MTISGHMRAQVISNQTSPDSISIKGDKYTKQVPGRLFNVSGLYSTGAVSTVSGEELRKTPTANITNTLFGRLPGLTVSTTSGEPGNDNADLAIRGSGSFGTNLWNSAKIFVDGFEVTSNYFSYIPAANIESISILKDAISLAQFGMHGADKAIWVVTKQGKTGKGKITFQPRYGIQSPVSINKPLGSYDFANLYNQAISNDNGNVWTPKYSDTDLQAYGDGSGTNVDWYKEVLKNKGAYSDGSLTFSGGDKLMNYFAGLNYSNQQGLFNVANSDNTSNQQFKTYNLFLNTGFKLFEIFDVKVNIDGRIQDFKRPYGGVNIMNDLANYPSNIYPVYDDRDLNHFSGTTIYPRNPYASLMATGWESNRSAYVKANFSLKERLDVITPGLFLEESGSFNTFSRTSYNKTANYARYINGATTTSDTKVEISASTLGAVSQDNLKQGKILLGYDRVFGNSRIQSALDYYLSSETAEGNYSYEVNYTNFNGRANYSFKDKYIAEFGFSYYGSDNYRKGNQHGFYPSAGIAWVLSNENLLKDNSLISYLKLRGSLGTSASADGGGLISTYQRFMYQQYYANSGNFYTGISNPGSASGLVPLFRANPDIFAEKSTKYNFGIDLTFLKKVSLTVDAYLEKRTGIIVSDITVPQYYSATMSFLNGGKMTSKGIDADLIFSDHKGNFGYSLKGMVSFNKNTIDYAAEIPKAFPYNYFTGRPYGTPIGLVSEGFYQTEDFNADGTLKEGLPIPFFGKVQAGDLKYSDLNNDKIVDQNDVTAIGKSPLPEITYSFGGSINYKRIDLSILFQGSAGSSVNLYNSARSQVMAFVNNGNAYPIAKGAWAYYPAQGIDTRQTATYPRLTTSANANNYRTSSFWMKNSDYMRLRNVEIGYSLNPSLISKVGLSEFRLYANAVNPLTFSKLLNDYNIDPEVFSGYPALKSYNFGFIATF